MPPARMLAAPSSGEGAHQSSLGARYRISVIPASIPLHPVGPGMPDMAAPRSQPVGQAMPPASRSIAPYTFRLTPPGQEQGLQISIGERPWHVISSAAATPGEHGPRTTRGPCNRRGHPRRYRGARRCAVRDLSIRFDKWDRTDFRLTDAEIRDCLAQLRPRPGRHPLRPGPGAQLR